MVVYQSPRGVLYILNNFAAFEVSTDRMSGPDGTKITSRLVATTISGDKMIIYSGEGDNAEAECQEELMAILSRLTPFNEG